jgi:hypothetical protein
VTPGIEVSAAPPAADPLKMQIQALYAVVLIVFISIGVVVAQRSVFVRAKPDETPEETRQRPKGTDFTAYYSAGELARNGQSIYDYAASSTPVRPYIYPPMFAVFPMAPLSLLPHNTAAVVFYVINIALLFGGMWLLWKILAPPGPPSLSFWRRPEVGCLIAIVVSWRFLHSNLMLGNANLYIFFFLVLALYLMTKGSFGSSSVAEPSTTPDAGTEVLAGIAVALATTFKLTPGLFGVYFFWTFRRWAMVGGALGLALFLLVFPSFLLGFSENWIALKAFVAHARDKAMAEEDDSPGGETVLIGRPKKAASPDDLPRAVGLSFRGTVTNLLTPTEALNRGNIKGSHSVNVATLDFKHAQSVADACAVVLLLVTVVLTIPAWTRAGTVPLALSWSLTTTAMVLVAPLTRSAHLVVLLIPFSVLIALLQQDRLSEMGKKLAWIVLLAFSVGGVLTSQSVLGNKWSQVVSSMGATTWSMVLLFIALAVIQFELRARPSPAKV